MLNKRFWYDLSKSRLLHLLARQKHWTNIHPGSIVIKKLLCRSEKRILEAILGLWRQKLSAKTTTKQSTNHVLTLEIRIEIAFGVELGLTLIPAKIRMEIIKILNRILTGFATILKSDPWSLIHVYASIFVSLYFKSSDSNTIFLLIKNF